MCDGGEASIAAHALTGPVVVVWEVYVFLSTAQYLRSTFVFSSTGSPNVFIRLAS